MSENPDGYEPAQSERLGTFLRGLLSREIWMWPTAAGGTQRIAIWGLLWPYWPVGTLYFGWASGQGSLWGPVLVARVFGRIDVYLWWHRTTSLWRRRVSRWFGRGQPPDGRGFRTFLWLAWKIEIDWDAP